MASEHLNLGSLQILEAITHLKECLDERFDSINKRLDSADINSGIRSTTQCPEPQREHLPVLFNYLRERMDVLSQRATEGLTEAKKNLDERLDFGHEESTKQFQALDHVLTVEFTDISDKRDELDTYLEQRFGDINKRLDNIDKRFDEIKDILNVAMSYLIGRQNYEICRQSQILPTTREWETREETREEAIARLRSYHLNHEK
ncbi:hypothetical protein F5Y10DRAFT_266093 [Nemania abortiva]|nr:hypothetical protein F5Y10DRAFT_266093 [Nemania abortiva]